jgi:hypothetical protein
MTHCFQTQLFNAGLQENIHKELMKGTYGSFQGALDLEVIQKENKAPKPVTVAAVHHGPLTLTPEEQEAITAIQAQCRALPSRNQ